jgi:ribosomal protein L7/L12
MEKRKFTFQNPCLMEAKNLVETLKSDPKAFLSVVMKADPEQVRSNLAEMGYGRANDDFSVVEEYVVGLLNAEKIEEAFKVMTKNVSYEKGTFEEDAEISFRQAFEELGATVPSGTYKTEDGATQLLGGGSFSWPGMIAGVGSALSTYFMVSKQNPNTATNPLDPNAQKTAEQMAKEEAERKEQARKSLFRVLAIAGGVLGAVLITVLIVKLTKKK